VLRDCVPEDAVLVEDVVRADADGDIRLERVDLIHRMDALHVLVEDVVQAGAGGDIQLGRIDIDSVLRMDIQLVGGTN